VTDLVETGRRVGPDGSDLVVSTSGTPASTSRAARGFVNAPTSLLPSGLDLFDTDQALTEAVTRHGAGQHAARLAELGRLAGSDRTQRWVELAHGHTPVLRSHDAFGRRADEIDHHPSWHRLRQAGVRAGLTAAAWHQPQAVTAHTARAAAMVIWSQTDIGHLAGLSTTYAAAPALGQEPELEKRWLPWFAARAYESQLRPAKDKLGALCGLAVSERHAGSDLQRVRTTAIPAAQAPVNGGAGYRLDGSKWCVASPSSDAFLVMAQAPGGLTCFLVPRVLDDGGANPWQVVRLERLLGISSTAVAEVDLVDTWGIRVGPEGAGRRVLAGTMAAMRLDGVLISAGLMRQVVVRAVHYARHRQAFGARLADKPLMQNVLADLAVESEATAVLGMRLAAAVDNGQAELLQAGVPVAAYWAGRRVVAHVAEGLECLGGNGYVESAGMARLVRDAAAPSIWAGTGNIAALDVLRVMTVRPRALEVLIDEIAQARGMDADLDAAIADVASSLTAAAREARRDPAAVESGARFLVERLATTLQASLLCRFSPGDVASMYLQTRLGRSGALAYGALPSPRRAIASMIERALPE
jgi:putative acyl-CoA dehydrogenase